MIGNWVFCSGASPALHPELSDKEVKSIDRELDKINKELFKNNKTLRKFGWHDNWGIFKESFEEATGKDLNYQQPSRSDIKMFKNYVKEWSKSLEKGFEGSFHAWKLLPQKLKMLPFGKETSQKIHHILSYERNHKNAAMNSLSNIKHSLTKLAGSKHFDVDTKVLAELEMVMMSSGKRSELEKAEESIVRYLGSMNSEGARSRAGDLYHGIIDALKGMDTDHLRKNNGRDPWSAREKSYAKNIQSAWIGTRKDLAVVAINALRMERDFAKRNDIRENHARGLDSFLENIDNKIKELEFTPAEAKDSRYNLSGEAKRDFNLEGHSLSQEQYMPYHTLTIMKTLDLFHQWMERPNPNLNETASQKFKDTLLVNNRRLIDRLKSRNEGAEEYYSRNPLFFISQYIHDITRYNYKRSLETVLTDSFDTLIKSTEFADRNNVNNVKQVTDFAEEAMKTLNNIAEESQLVTGPYDTRGRKLSRLFTSMGFIRTMGFNVRSPIRNYTQKFFEYIDMGFRARKIADAYIDNVDIENAVTYAQNKHGLSWAKDDSFLKRLTSSYNDAAATRGSKETSILPPGLAEVDGRVMIVKESLFDKTLRYIDTVADVSSFMHRNIEGVIRQHTFRTSYGLAHKNLSEMPDWWVNQEMGRKNTTAKERRAWTDRTAGELAYNKVIEVHYEYSKIQKPDILKGPVGSVIGQFKQYRFSNIDMQYNWIKSGINRIKSGGFREYEAHRLYRLGIAYGISSGLTAALGLGFNNLFQNDTAEWLHNYWLYWSADRSTKEGRKQAEKALYGKGELSELGPTFSAGFELLEIFGKMKIEHDHKLAILGITNNVSPMHTVDDLDRNYRLTRLANLQAARSWFHTKEAFLNKNYWKSFLTETGLYVDSDTRKTSDNVMSYIRELTGTKTYKKDKRRKQQIKARLKAMNPMYANALKSLDRNLSTR